MYKLISNNIKMSNQMNNNRNGNQRMNGNNNRNNNNGKYKYNLSERTPVFRPRVYNENNEQISLFIPRVDVRTSFEKVGFVFHHYYLGKVKNVDFVLKQDKNGYDYKAAYIHFDHFYNSENCCSLINTIRDHGSDEVCCDKYDRNKRWQVFINTGKKHSGDKPKARLNLDLLEAKVMLNESYVESKPSFDPRFEAILMKQKEEYEAQIALLKAELESGTIVFDKGPDLTIADIKGGINNEYLKDYEQHKFAEDRWRMSDASEMDDDMEEGEVRDA